MPPQGMALGEMFQGMSQRGIEPSNVGPTMHFFSLPPEDLARKIGYENWVKLFKLDK